MSEALVHRVQLHVIGGSMRRHTRREARAEHSSPTSLEKSVADRVERARVRSGCSARSSAMTDHLRARATASHRVRQAAWAHLVAGGAAAARDRARAERPGGRAGRSGVRGLRRGAAARLQRGVVGGLRVGRVGRASRVSRARRAGGG